jgi:hypothetical protein
MLPIHLPNVFSNRIWGVGSSRIWGVGSSPLFRFPEIVLFWSKWKTLDTDKRRSFIDVQGVKHGKNVVLS